ncbi:hypothetical protein IGI37_003569 [Enterococcus sp. AZ194]|uniref:hypothetical protein n=1 Tax=Enterococcus sp. AZ194 TaxID=2774629 RepID=UPI003F28FFD7
MKNKRARYFVIFTFLMLILFVGGWRYSALNKEYQTQALVTVVPIQEKETVKTDKIQFTVKDKKTWVKNNTFYAELSLTVKLLEPNSYGFKKDSLYFYENMWLDVPYRDRVSAFYVKNSDGTSIDWDKLTLPKELNIKINFSKNQEFINYENKPVYFSFLYPEGTHFAKYQLLLRE